ncbi:MAG: GNAT family N-acetyltransferase [Tepidisphaerales bacterium]
MLPFRFRFFDLARPSDGMIRLVSPHEQWVDELVRAEAMSAAMNADDGPEGRPWFGEDAARERALNFLRACPGGRDLPRGLGGVPAYHFWMVVEPDTPLARQLPIKLVGGLSLRIGNTRELRYFSGHIGYQVYGPARGHHFAERGVRLVLPLAARHHLKPVWITVNPDNIASRRTCERLGATLVDVVTIPETHPFYLRGERAKCRYRIDP